jgi:hypothetical protein
MTCAALASSFKDKEIVSMTTRAIPGNELAPAHCRVSGILSPEIGFEVNLPAKWNERLYMLGNGGLAGEQPDDPGRHSVRIILNKQEYSRHSKGEISAAEARRWRAPAFLTICIKVYQDTRLLVSNLQEHATEDVSTNHGESFSRPMHRPLPGL